MNEPILFIREKNIIEILTYALFCPIFIFVTILDVLEKEFFLGDVFMLLFAIGIPLIFILNSAMHTLCVYEDYVTEKGLLFEDDIFFEEVYSIRYGKATPTRDNMDIEKKYYLIFENQNEEEIDRIDLSVFNSTSELQQFITFIQQYQPHISFDVHVKKMANGTFHLPNRIPYFFFTFMLLFNVISFYFILNN